ncbi:hypothetical protein IPM19_04380 [bacterium]|nr:MAG: hypothetical protein IPM19_04380 [bacterium]
MEKFEQPRYTPDPETAMQHEMESQEFIEVGKKQIAEARESEERRWQEKPVDQLRPADLLRLDKEGHSYIKELLGNLSIVQGRGRINAELLVDAFFKTARDIQKDFPDATIKEILALGRDQIYSRIAKVLPEGTPLNPEDVKFTEGARNDVKSAATLLRLNIEKYARENGNLLGEPSGFSALIGAIRKNIVGESKESADRQKLREELQEQITFLRHLEDDPEILKDNFNHKILSIETDRSNHDESIVRTLTLPYALKYSSIYIPSLTDYINEVQSPDKILGRMIQEKVVKAFEMVSEGYGEKEFSQEESVAQFTAGTATSPGGGNYAGMTKGLVEKVRVLNAIGQEDAGASRIEVASRGGVDNS